MFRWNTDYREITNQIDISTLVPVHDEKARCVADGRITGNYQLEQLLQYNISTAIPLPAQCVTDRSVRILPLCRNVHV